LNNFGVLISEKSRGKRHNGVLKSRDMYFNQPEGEKIRATGRKKDRKQKWARNNTLHPRFHWGGRKGTKGVLLTETVLEC